MSLLAIIPPGMEWAVLVLCVFLVVEAYIDLVYLKVPNKLTFPMIFSGWLLALVVGWNFGADFPQPTVPFELFWFIKFDLHSPTAYALSHLWSSVAMTFIALACLVWLYALGGMGAGDVKMLSGYGAWIVAIYGWNKGFWIVIWSYLFAIIVGGVISAIMIWWRGDYKQNLKNTKEILGDIGKGVATMNLPEISKKAAERKPRLQLLPYGVPLCIGFIAWVILDHWNLYYLVDWLFPLWLFGD
jgi:prepilin peptidase CpaA